jgi:hypothetical protein
VNVLRSLAPALLAPLLLAAPARAQVSSDPWTGARFHFGVVALGPSISIANVGLDTNVFASSDNPQRDWTATFVPATTAILRLGRARLTGQGDLAYQYFHTFESERSLNTRGSLRLLVPFNRLELTVGATAMSSRQRQGSEITERVRRLETAANLEANVRLTGRSWVGVTANRRRYSFPDDAEFFDTNLSVALDRIEESAGFVYLNRVTPLTTLRVTTETQRDRFLRTTGRDADSTRVMGGFETSPQTLLQGSALVGYQWYEPVSSAVPGFDGVVAAADLSYVARGATRLSVRVDRSLAYSYDVVEPYYVTTGVSATLGRHIVRRLELLLSGGRQRMNYRRSGTGNEGVSRADWSATYGGGLAYGFGGSGRVRVNFDGTSRESVITPQNYEGRLISASLDYAF